MFIGVTERGDASLDYSWVYKLQPANIIITKNLTDRFINTVRQHQDKIILHATCTGFGGTPLEPNVPSWQYTIDKLHRLIALGFPQNQIVLRIDPIIPKGLGLKKLHSILASNPPVSRIRFSFLDMYPHVIKRFEQANITPPYTSFHAPQSYINDALAIIADFDNKFTFESCAENTKYQKGCISATDLEILHIDPSILTPGGFQRKGCLCAGNKKELLSTKAQCKHRCIYCYWRG